jgi:hypothetical protein
MAEHDWKVDIIVHPDGVIGDESDADPSRGRDTEDVEPGKGGALADSVTIAASSILIDS